MSALRTALLIIGLALTLTLFGLMLGSPAHDLQSGFVPDPSWTDWLFSGSLLGPVLLVGVAIGSALDRAWRRWR